MPLPAGVTTTTVTAGPYIDAAGNGAEVVLEVVPDFGGVDTIVHVVTGAALEDYLVCVTAAAGAQASIDLPNTDQAGTWIDGSGNPVVSFRYLIKVRRTLRTGRKTQPAPPKSWTLAVPVGSSTIDLDKTIGGAAAPVYGTPQYQPLDDDLTAIAAQGTTTFGRARLADADAVAARAALLAFGAPVAWAASAAVKANSPVILPTGGLGYSLTDRTTRASFDATERAAWTFVPGNHTETLTASGSWTCPTGVTVLTELDVLAGGGGGGGGGAASAISNQVGGGGGGAGERTTYRALVVTAGSTGTATVGTGGAGGAGGASGGGTGAVGTNGGVTTFVIGGTTYRSNGGGKGTGGGNNSASAVNGGSYGWDWGVGGVSPGGGGNASNTTGAVGIPVDGVVGGGGGGPATATNGGGNGSGRTTPGGTSGVGAAGGSATAAGMNGTTATIPGCGGGGGGGGAPGGAGGTGGTGARGEIVIRF